MMYEIPLGNEKTRNRVKTTSDREGIKWGKKRKQRLRKLIENKVSIVITMQLKAKRRMIF